MRCVIKISSQLTTRVAEYAKIIIWAMEQGHLVVSVVGGSVREGLQVLRLSDTPLDQQVAAGVGQIRMMQCWGRACRRSGVEAAQLLFTHDDVLVGPNNIREVIERCWELRNPRVALFANANDVVLDREARLTAKVSENAMGAAILARRLEADKLFLLGLVPGVFTTDPSVDPSAELIREVTELDPAFAEQFSDESQDGSFGGMRKTVEACIFAASAGSEVYVACGRPAGNLRRLFQGEEIGTVFRPNAARRP